MPAPSFARCAASVACRGVGCSATCARSGGRSRLALVGLVISSAVGLAFPLIIAGVVTQVVAGGDSAGLDALIVMLIALFLVQAAGGFLQTYLLGVVGERVVAQLRGELFGRLITLSLDFHSSHRVGELISRLSSDVTLVRTMLTQTVTSLLSSLIGLVGSVIILFTLSPTLLLVILLLAPALIAVAVVFGRPLQRVSTQVQDTIARQHHDRRGGAVRDPRGQELRARGLGARALRQGPADGRRDRIAPGALASGVRDPDGVPGLRGHRRAAVVHGPPGHRGHARDRDADRVPAVRRGHRGEPGDDREPVRAVPGGDRRHRAGVRDHRYAAHRRSTHPMPADGNGRGPDRARRRVVRLPARPAGASRPLTRPSRRGRPWRWSGRRARARPRSSGSSRACGT